MAERTTAFCFGTPMTLAKAKAAANKLFQAAKADVVAGKISARAASEGLISIFWGISRQVRRNDKPSFHAWFEKKHAALGKELGAK